MQVLLSRACCGRPARPLGPGPQRHVGGARLPGGRPAHCSPRGRPSQPSRRERSAMICWRLDSRVDPISGRTASADPGGRAEGIRARGRLRQHGEHRAAAATGRRGPRSRPSRRGGPAVRRRRTTTSWSTARAGDSPVSSASRPDRVAIGNQVSTFTGLVAAALPDGARVLAAEEDFTSVLFPFLAHADRGVRVQTVPLERPRRGHRPRRESRGGERGAVGGRPSRSRWARCASPRPPPITAA